jgi:uncharacterized oligopeptide transporter (OPT) family protein
VIANVMRGVFKSGLPIGTIVTRAIFGAVVALFDLWFEGCSSRWRASIMPVAIGLYLPLGASVWISAGSLVRMMVRGTESTKGTGRHLATGSVGARR